MNHQVIYETQQGPLWPDNYSLHKVVFLPNEEISECYHIGISLTHRGPLTQHVVSSMLEFKREQNEIFIEFKFHEKYLKLNGPLILMLVNL